MGLMCSCDSDYYEPGMKLWHSPEEFSVLATKRRRNCCSCGTVIAVGDTCAVVPRTKVPEFDIELRIYGEDGEIPIASKHLCETCAGLAFSLAELGYCPQPWEDQRELVRDYAAEHAPNAQVTSRPSSGD